LEGNILKKGQFELHITEQGGRLLIFDVEEAIVAKRLSYRRSL
jgi:hypothetical protein